MAAYSTIKPKVGQCKDCPTTGPLIAGRCQPCYWRSRAKVNAQKPAAKARQDKKQDLTPWFNMQLSMCPQLCENPACREPLRESMAINPRTVVAHILPKSPTHGFPEVATHPLNRAFLCQTCHGRYDNGRAETMPELLELCRSRLAHFIDKVAPENVKRIPDYLL